MKAIDLFAGAGGFTLAAIKAGIKVLWAGNHWPEAVKIHAQNHPETLHMCQDLNQADWGRVPAHDLLLASPECGGHAKARGKERPHHDKSRSTAWAVISCAEYHRPRFLLVENVPEFLKWDLFPVWIEALKILGYHTKINILNSADFGIPQSRIRVFITGCLNHEISLKSQKKKHRPAISIIDSDGKWGPINKPGRSKNTLAQVEQGRKIHGKLFLIAYNGNEKKGRSIYRPIGTITTVERWAIIDGKFMRMLKIDEYRKAMGFPATYQLPSIKKDAIKMLGNAVVPPLVQNILEQIKQAA